ncbi:hypothetical protein KC355_g1184, partial [Hortaea werneckii]
DGSHDPRADDEDARLADDDAEDAKSDDDEAAQAEDGAGTPAESDDEEHIVVTRPEDQRDPEAEAEFDRELAKMMAESVESRRTERKPMFDVPLPMRRTVRDATSTADDSGGESPAPAAPGQGTMKFALLSKKGNRQQTRSIDLPSDSNFAIAMRNQQEAERAEQQRIKNLVLNYDLTDDQNDGIPQPNFHYVHSRNGTRTRLVGNGSLNKSLAPPAFFRAGGRSQRSTSSGIKDDDDGNAKKPVHPGTFESLHGQPRIDKSGNTRSKQRSRKLQLSDVDW